MIDASLFVLLQQVILSEFVVKDFVLDASLVGQGWLPVHSAAEHVLGSQHAARISPQTPFSREVEFVSI